MKSWYGPHGGPKLNQMLEHRRQHLHRNPYRAIRVVMRYGERYNIVDATHVSWVWPVECAIEAMHG
jgi:hypothetical protein